MNSWLTQLVEKLLAVKQIEPVATTSYLQLSSYTSPYLQHRISMSINNTNYSRTTIKVLQR